MKRHLLLTLCVLCAAALCACSAKEEGAKWDCTVECMEESTADSYVISYSDAEVVSSEGVLSFQNRNDFDIVVHLLSAGSEERVIDVYAGGVAVQYQLEKGTVYTVGCHADVEIGTEIALMVYDGERSEPY